MIIRETSDHHARPEARPEARIATHDGFIWPTPRSEMRESHAIIARMAEDMAALYRERGSECGITQIDLQALGWNYFEVQHYGPRASSIFVAALEKQAA